MASSPGNQNANGARYDTRDERSFSARLTIQLHGLGYLGLDSDLTPLGVPHERASANRARHHPKQIPHGSKALREAVSSHDHDIEQPVGGRYGRTQSENPWNDLAAIGHQHHRRTGLVLDPVDRDDMEC